MTLEPLSPLEARRLLDGGAILVDVREADEHARERIPGARNLPLARIAEGARVSDGTACAVIYHCRSGARTRENAETLAEAAGCKAYLVEGGLEAWRKAGLAVALDRRQPLPLMRQVQIGAGGLALLGVVLGYLASPSFFLLSGFVGAGLLQAGLTGWCGMANLLRLMPWNRQQAA